MVSAIMSHKWKAVIYNNESQMEDGVYNNESQMKMMSTIMSHKWKMMSTIVR